MPGTATRHHTTWCHHTDHPEHDCTSLSTDTAGITTFIVGSPGAVVAYVAGYELDGPGLDQLIDRLQALRVHVTPLPAPRTASA